MTEVRWIIERAWKNRSFDDWQEWVDQNPNNFTWLPHNTGEYIDRIAGITEQEARQAAADYPHLKFRIVREERSFSRKIGSSIYE